MLPPSCLLFSSVPISSTSTRPGQHQPRAPTAALPCILVAPLCRRPRAPLHQRASPQRPRPDATPSHPGSSDPCSRLTSAPHPFTGFPLLPSLCSISAESPRPDFRRPAHAPRPPASTPLLPSPRRASHPGTPRTPVTSRLSAPALVNARPVPGSSLPWPPSAHAPPPSAPTAPCPFPPFSAAISSLAAPLDPPLVALRLW